MSSHNNWTNCDARQLALDTIEGFGGPERQAARVIIESVRKLVPFDGFSISGLDIGNCTVGNGIHLASTLPQDFMQAYTAGGLFRLDPMVKQVSPLTPVARWHSVPENDLRRPGSHRLLAALRYYGIAPRTAITLWNGDRLYSALTFTRDKPFSQHEIDSLLLLSPGIYSRLAQPVIDGMNKGLKLSEGERACLQLAAEGLTSDEIAAASRYTVDTVTSYIKSSTKKLNASNRTQAIANALRRKIIH